MYIVFVCLYLVQKYSIWDFPSRPCCIIRRDPDRLPYLTLQFTRDLKVFMSCVCLMSFGRLLKIFAPHSTGKSLSEALLFAEYGGDHFVYRSCSECLKQFLYTTCSPQVWAWNFHVLNLEFNEQSVKVNYFILPLFLVPKLSSVSQNE